MERRISLKLLRIVFQFFVEIRVVDVIEVR